ncbi:MAG: gliding motility-associated C-terminal domain-containing protein [Bacteroidales bacterium]|nr:gliding motility-associated C-terminal domain-containing protein [Bacteroidales bacterium]
MMKKFILFIFFLITIIPSIFATHERAGEITYKHITGLTYEITIVTYTFTPSPANRIEMLVLWGDGSASIIPLIEKINYPNNISRNVYGGIEARHTFAAPATYIISVEDPNRNYGVLNIPNSVNIPFYTESELVINPFLGVNNSPVLLNPPFDNGCVNRLYLHNPGAYDVDGDSLSYQLIECKGANGLPIPGYSLPMASNIFSIDSYSGDVIWDMPEIQGEYNIAILIKEWRNGYEIGSIIRDMQINIVACDNLPPEIFTIDDTCVEAGSFLEFDVVATDEDDDLITLTATGGPIVMQNNPAEFPIVDSLSKVTSTFSWPTVCSHVQKYPYQVYFKAIDNSMPVNLVDIKTVNIKVIGPPPENLSAEAIGNNIHLNWDKTICENAIGYKLFRRKGYYGFIHGVCETGVPAYTGYKLIKEIKSIEDTIYVDDNNGIGLVHGIYYCYIIIAYYPDGAESYASLEACASLKRDLPIITNVSNDSSNLGLGHCFLAWAKPVELDTIKFPGPFQYQIFRAIGIPGSDFQLIGNNIGLNDTLYFDKSINLNQDNNPYSYKIGLHSESIGEIGSTQNASSLFINIYETDEELQLSWSPYVPWNNEAYIIYRQDPEESDYDSLGWTNDSKYYDRNLINGEKYCYYIKSVGDYDSPGLISPIINFSQQKCGKPIDNKPPCPPELFITTNCDYAENILTWTNPNNFCCDDVAKYNVYYSHLETEELTILASVFGASDTTFTHQGSFSIAGCYAVTAIDSIGNESDFSNIVCIDIDSCSIYSLPNVFTPNNDGRNDYFIPFPFTSVERIDIEIFDRWGRIVFETHDPKINWDGKNKNNNSDCSAGVYFYVCDVYEMRLSGLTKRTLSGSVTILRE